MFKPKPTINRKYFFGFAVFQIKVQLLHLYICTLYIPPCTFQESTPIKVQFSQFKFGCYFITEMTPGWVLGYLVLRRVISGTVSTSGSLGIVPLRHYWVLSLSRTTHGISSFTDIRLRNIGPLPFTLSERKLYSLLCNEHVQIFMTCLLLSVEWRYIRYISLPFNKQKKINYEGTGMYWKPLSALTVNVM